MARYLGYTLVEGGDLTVRGNTVFLKTLGGLLPVDVILRRIPDDDCDPLELEPQLAVWHRRAGAVAARRRSRRRQRHRLRLSRSAGAGGVSASGLPVAVRRRLALPVGADLVVRQCGTICNYVEANLKQLIVRHAFKRRAAPPIAGRRI